MFISTKIFPSATIGDAMEEATFWLHASLPVSKFTRISARTPDH